ncbi:hypothetical protein B0H10DRAFT_1955352 [Mycena sp. CBHHK59/15]|nr:hypothetical protein B0H10DRAFT_1955352 [Mycena sp. CBHHK59/15]
MNPKAHQSLCLNQTKGFVQLGLAANSGLDICKQTLHTTKSTPHIFLNEDCTLSSLLHNCQNCLLKLLCMGVPEMKHTRWEVEPSQRVLLGEMAPHARAGAHAFVFLDCHAAYHNCGGTQGDPVGQQKGQPSRQTENATAHMCGAGLQRVGQIRLGPDLSTSSSSALQNLVPSHPIADLIAKSKEKFISPDFEFKLPSTDTPLRRTQSQSDLLDNSQFLSPLHPPPFPTQNASMFPSTSNYSSKSTPSMRPVHSRSISETSIEFDLDVTMNLFDEVEPQTLLTNAAAPAIPPPPLPFKLRGSDSAKISTVMKLLRNGHLSPIDLLMEVLTNDEYEHHSAMFFSTSGSLMEKVLDAMVSDERKERFSRNGSDQRPSTLRARPS